MSKKYAKSANAEHTGTHLGAGMIMRWLSIVVISIADAILVGCGTLPSYPVTDRQTAGVFLELDDAKKETEDPFETTSIPFVPARAVTGDGVAMLKEFEGAVRCKTNASRHCPYNDASRFCTIGHGHLVKKAACEDITVMLKDLGFSSGITDERATELLTDDLKLAQQGIERQIIEDKVGKTEINEFQYDALVSFIFNVGVGNFSNSTLLKELNKRSALGDNPTIAYQFSRWVKSNGIVLSGLVSRRRREAEHFFDGFETEGLIPFDETEEETTATYEDAVDIRIGE